LKLKRLIVFCLLALISALPLAGCSSGKPAESTDEDGKLRIVATIFAPYDFARAVAGDRADIKMLVPPGAETHSFEPTPQDILAIRNCDLFLYVGGESDEWVREILESMEPSDRIDVPLIDCVEPLEEEIVEGMQEEEEEEEGGAEYDEHVWTSPRNAKLIVRRISGALLEADPEGAAVYEQNTSEYLAALDALDARFSEVVEGGARRTVVFGDRFPFRYLAEAYSLTYYAAFPGCSTETEASAATIRFLIDKVKEEDIPVVFHIELSSHRIADTISESTGAKVLLLHACHNISKDDFTGGKTYLELMDANVEALREALS